MAGYDFDLDQQSTTLLLGCGLAHQVFSTEDRVWLTVLPEGKECVWSRVAMHLMNHDG